MINSKKLFGFTISELLIALAIIGILTAVLMPLAHSLIPDENILMAKRTFYTTETILSKMINDKSCYPPIRVRDGFEDGKGYTNCTIWNESNNNDADKKFIKIFTDYIDIDGSAATSEDGKTTFETKDSAFWEFKEVNFGAKTYTILTIDVNGKTKGPNCGQNSESGVCEDESRTNNFDKYTLYIQPSGKVEIQDCWAILAVHTDKKLHGNTGSVENCNP